MLITFHTHCGKEGVSRLINIFSRGATHTSIRVNEYVWEAHIDTGITKTHIDIWKPSSPIVDRVHFTIPNGRGDELVQWLNKQEGKGYDFFGILSFLWILIPQKKGKWYCSEFGAVILYKFIVQAKEYVQKKNPRELRIDLHIFKKILGI